MSTLKLNKALTRKPGALVNKFLLVAGLCFFTQSSVVLGQPKSKPGVDEKRTTKQGEFRSLQKGASVLSLLPRTSEQTTLTYSQGVFTHSLECSPVYCTLAGYEASQPNHSGFEAASPNKACTHMGCLLLVHAASQVRRTRCTNRVWHL